MTDQTNTFTKNQGIASADDRIILIDNKTNMAVWVKSLNTAP